MEGLLNVDVNLKNHFMLTSAAQVSQICRPLFDLLNINYFGMHRVYTDGYRARLTTNADWLEHYYSSKLYLSARLERHPSLYKNSYSLWDEWPTNDDSFFKVHKQMKDLYDRDHGFSIIKTQKTHMDVFILTSSSKNKNTNSIYLRHLEEIQKFLIYFMGNFSSLINEAHKNRFRIEIDNETFLSEDGSHLQITPQLKEFYEKINLDYVIINTEKGLVKLTKRETDCLMFLLKLNGVKEIARELYLSPRTIESHLNSIKNKLHINSTTSLIKKIMERDSYEYLEYRYWLWYENK